MGARSAAMGYASATISDDWSLLNNTAGLTKLTQSTCGFAYALNPSLPGADRLAAAVNLPIKLGVFGAGVFKFGDELYSEQIISAGYANQLGLASLGVKINYIQYRADGLGTQSVVSINFGGIAEITPLISVGAYIVNINQPKLSSVDEERLPVKLVSGIQFNPSDELLLVLEIEKDINYDPTIKSGIEYIIHQKIKVRTGFNLGPNSIHGGIGYYTSRLNVDYALHYNPSIKTQFQISSGYKFGKRKQKE
jgi:hypothetical protein